MGSKFDQFRMIGACYKKQSKVQIRSDDSCKGETTRKL